MKIVFIALFVVKISTTLETVSLRKMKKYCAKYTKNRKK